MLRTDSTAKLQIKNVIVEPPVNNDKNHLRIRQAMAQSDPSMISVGLKILAAKTGNQSALLKYFAKYRKKTTPLLADKLRRAAELLFTGIMHSSKRDMGSLVFPGAGTRNFE